MSGLLEKRRKIYASRRRLKLEIKLVLSKGVKNRDSEAFRNFSNYGLDIFEKCGESLSNVLEEN